MKSTYNFDFDNVPEERIARAFFTNKPVSIKYCAELARELKGMRVDKAEAYLQRVIEKKDFVPLRKYNKAVGHKRGNAKSKVKAGRFPKNASKEMLRLIASAKANADYKGLDETKLFIIHALASIGYRRPGQQPQGKISGKSRLKKSSHLEIVLLEK